MKNKTVAALFSRLKNVDILKFPGMTLNYISALTDDSIRCLLISLNNDNYTYYDSFGDNYDLILLDKEKKYKSPYIPVFSYLRKNAATVDILILYHLDLESYFYSLVYKLYNKNGKVLLQLDADERIREFFAPAKRKGVLEFTNNIRPLKNNILKGLTKRADYIAAETTRIYEYLMDNADELFKQKLFINPYGVNVDELESYSDPGITKENIFLTVGRIGNYQKNNEVFINAIKKIKNPCDWKFYFVGPLEEGFEVIIENLYRKYPGLKGSVFFTGEIKDRKLLCKYMQSSKVFCLTSRYESWGIVLVEAAFFNNYIISTDVGCAKDIIQNMVSGKLIKDEDDLSVILNAVINGEVSVECPEKQSKKEYLLMNSWEKTVSELLKVIKLS